MSDTAIDKLRLAAHCVFLKRAVEPGRLERSNLCEHAIRDGKECVGPFLDDLGTSCGLWEPHPQADAIPLPTPERWQRRRRREGWDYRRAYGD